MTTQTAYSPNNPGPAPLGHKRMTTQTAKKKAARKPKDPRARLLRQIKELLGALGILEDRANECRNRLFSNAYQYVQWCVTCRRAKTIGEGIAALSKSIGKAAPTVESWYYCGRLIHEQDLPDTADAQSIRSLSQRKNKLPKTTWHQALTKLKNNEPHCEILKLVYNSPIGAKKKGDDLSYKMKSAGMLNAKGVKIQAMTLVRIAERAFERNVIVQVLDAETKKVLVTSQ